MKFFTDIKAVALYLDTQCLYLKKLDPDFSPSPGLLENFIRDVVFFANDQSGQELNTIDMGNLKLYLRIIDQSLNLNMIVITIRDISDKKIRKTMDDLKDAFLDVYEVDKIAKYATEPNYFDNFSVPLGIILFKRFQVVVE